MKKEEIMPKEILDFLKEYQELCQKYKFGLDGCGCCDSPSIWRPKTELIRNINYNYELNCITVEDEYFGAYKMDEDDLPGPIMLDEYLKKIGDEQRK